MSRHEFKPGDIVRWASWAQGDEPGIGIVVEPDAGIHDQLVALNWIIRGHNCPSYKHDGDGKFHAKSDIWVAPEELEKIGRADD